MKERRAHLHFQAQRAQVPSEGLAFRKRKRVPDVELALVLYALLASAVGWDMRTAGLDPDTSAILIAGGLTCSVMATVFTGIVALATRIAGARA